MNDASALVHCLSAGHPLQSRRGAQAAWRDERPMSVTSRTKRKEGGIAETSFVFERAQEPYTKSITYPLRVTPEWRRVAVRFAAEESYAPGEAQMIFRLGYEPQTIEVGGVSSPQTPRKNAKKCTTQGSTPIRIIGGAITMTTRM